LKRQQTTAIPPEGARTNPDFSARENSTLLFTGENVNYKPLPNTPQSCLPLKVL
jgi:hypothetical protein